MHKEVAIPETSSPSGSKSKNALFEPFALLLLSLATVGTAWCSFQAASWQGAAGGLANLAEASTRKAVTSELQSSQMAVIDILLFSQYINARANSNEVTAQFYADRFRPEAKAAFQAWLATKPFEASGAPLHPFVPSLYKPKLLTEAEEARAESQRLGQLAGEAGRNGRGYILITVVLACALFCGGTAAKFERAWIRRTVLALGLSSFAFAAIRLLALPIQH
jgi:hypothetical protein